MGALTSGGTSNRSNIASIGTTLDPMHYFWKATTGRDYVNEFLEDGTEKLNWGVSKVTKPVNKFFKKGDPFVKSLEKTFGKQQFVEDWNATVENRPIDAAAIAAAVYFGAAGAAGAGGSGAGAGAATAGEAAAPAASAGSTAGASVGGMTAAEAAITPTFASGVGATGAGLSATGTGAATTAITPTFASGVVSAGTGGSGALGAAGTAALSNSLTYSPMASGITGAGITGTGAGGGTGTVGGVAGSQANGSWIDTVKEIYDYGKKAKNVYDQFKPKNQSPNQQNQFQPNQRPMHLGTNQTYLQQANGGQQPLDAFSQQLQSQLQDIINRQKSANW